MLRILEQRWGGLLSYGGCSRNPESRLFKMNESDVKAALRAQGIRDPSRQLVSDWLRMQQSQEWALELPDSAQEVPSEPSSAGEAQPSALERPSSKSNLAPLLRERGELQRPAGRRKPGRPRVQAPWFQAVATVMSDGTTLRQALAAVGVHGLTERQIRSLYRNSVLKAMRREARQKWLREWGVKPRTRRRYGCKSGLPLGVSPQLRQLL